MTFSKSILGAAAAVSLTLAMALPASAAGLNLTLTGASPGGLWSRIGGGIDAAIAKAYPGSTVSYQTSSGGLANIPLVSRGKVPMGLATDGELNAVYNGYKGKAALKNVRVLFRAYAPSWRFQATHLILSKNFADKHGIKTFADIVNKKAPLRVAINRRGNMDSDVSAMVMALMGATTDKIKSWGGQVVHAASKEMVSLYLDRRIDMVNFGIAYKHPRVREIAKGVTPVLLPIPDDVSAKVAKAFAGATCPIKPGDYKWAPAGSSSVCIGAVIVVNASMDNGTAYNLAKGMVEQIEEFKKKSHRLIAKNAKKKFMAVKAAAPFHPGAAKYFKEAGLM